LENHQKSPKKRNDLQFCNDLWVSTVPFLSRVTSRKGTSDIFVSKIIAVYFAKKSLAVKNVTFKIKIAFLVI